MNTSDAAAATGFASSKVAAANQAIASSTLASDVVTAIENDPNVKQGLQTTVGPWVRTYGSSPIFCFAVYLITWEAQRALGLQLDPQFTQAICGLLGMGAGYLWQKVSITWGKHQAPVQPTPATPPAP
jgi:hypothetical protein